MVLIFRLGLLGLLALSESALASPQRLGKSAAPAAASSAAASAAPKAVATTAPAPASATVVTVPESEINAAPITDLPPTNPSLKQIPGAPLAPVLAARPDLQGKIDQQPALETSILQNKTKSKRTLSKRNTVAPLFDPGNECVNHGGPKVAISVWILGIKKVCNHWFPDHTLVTYVPSAAGFTSQFSVGGGGITLTFQYGVTDLGSGFLWYEPFSYDICVADLTGLIADMNDQCLFDDGVDLGFVPLGVDDIQPFSPSLKFYGFHD